MSRLVVDPITRIEGHLRVEAQVANGTITDAWTSTTMWRGLEQIVQGRDPRDVWYFAQRVCGVCTTDHALASIRAAEAAVGVTIPPNAHYLRDLIAASQIVHDHVVHFYHLHALDWVDVVSALSASPSAAAQLGQSLSDYPNNTVAQLTAVQTRLKTFVAGGKLGPFANGYWGHPAYQLPPEANLLAVSHYLDALAFQREYVKVHAILGGKNPHPQSYVLGGMTMSVDPNGKDTLNDDKLAHLRDLLVAGQNFVRQALLPDCLAVASFYPQWAALGAGPKNYLSFGDFRSSPMPADQAAKPVADGVLPAGLIRNGDLSSVTMPDADLIAEEVTNAWYRYDGGDATPLRPFDGETKPHYTGPTPPYDQLDVSGKYSWLKSPRYDGKVVEVGPLARMLLAYARGDALVRGHIDAALAALKVGPEALHSTLGRTFARAVEADVLATHSLDVLDQLTANIASGDLNTHDNSKFEPKDWPARCQGVGFVEAPRGTLSHWIKIADQQTERYQMVVPSTWNAGPRDAKGQRGAYEVALQGTPVAKPEQPLELLRTVHSFDPCMACAAHILDADGNPVLEVKVQ
ncbi:MAG: nickel-dependent hydrogenase large subunit [Actinomycetia bacterium]|nr:nickel-dependent hydrogenase large subunit [Actinomycetes bacterium]